MIFKDFSEFPRTADYLDSFILTRQWKIAKITRQFTVPGGFLWIGFRKIAEMTIADLYN